jgi:branched-chain amino acid transport system ATP-binding protein
VAARGIAHVPEGRQLFPTMTVRENLELGAYNGRPRARVKENLERVNKLFPRLLERRSQVAGSLSGGEQQMLTICRTLMGDPDLIMIDEPTEGLAPQMVERIAELLRNIAKRGISILLVEQRLTIALRISHRLYVMGHGRMVFEGSPEDLQADPSVRQTWLEV